MVYHVRQEFKVITMKTEMKIKHLTMLLVAIMAVIVAVIVEGEKGGIGVKVKAQRMCAVQSNGRELKSCLAWFLIARCA